MAATLPAIQWDKWDAISKLLDKNPNKALTLREDTLAGCDETAADTIADLPGSAKDWQEYPIHPPGHIAALLYCRDFLFAQSPAKLRQQTLIDASTEIPQELDEKIRATHHARYRKKALEWLGMPASKLDKADHAKLWDILMTVFGYQCIVIDTHNAANVRFAPEDIRTWSEDKQLIVVNEDLTYIWLSIRWSMPALAAWLDGRTTVKWPVADGSKLELLEKWERDPTYMPEHRKLKKDDLAALVGKSESIRHLNLKGRNTDNIE
jgi:hypothetical protein